METPSTSESRMNSWRIGVHFCPVRVRKSIANSHSSKVRSVLLTYSCSDFTSSCSRNLARGSGVLSKLLTTAAVSSVSLNWVIWGYPAERHDEVAPAYTHVPAMRKHKQLERDTLFGYQPPTCPSVPETPSMLAPTPASPESAGMSTAALNRIEDHLKQRYIDAGRFPGTQLTVYRRGKIVHSTSQGFADLERKVAVKDDTIFRIYSMTKPITTVAFMMLVEEGRVALDEPVHKYIPEWKNLGVFVAGTSPAFLTRPPSRPMLIVDLLRHTSGLTYGIQRRSNVDAAYRERKIGEVVKSGSLASMIDDLAKLPLEFSPGEAWNYSVATDVIGYLIGKISGMTFEQVLKERIFKPL